uniref:JmjC domain-containing protein n=1 Tax=Aureoumbra lagunensis TaxID=44058 RepID=A0A6S8DCI1_9STRA|mmetsp:Transcript_15865/g.23859  ORF Transcript_15865/g.23859 Transcript_15865/m.23859 type:complete len:512 (+) Transcript_15865:9-1544(+)|eukprot:CAMPEP_0197307984 /NCGR_PEP_ID=MMETSP0891-20130614/6129_1 /TAXON_ID=44058 ORGANISM="Aureoumbra lagunensis, Strain CCMP1510" /NCGR_SAMPLE_ID=MMETSP0891 /ASSEMBLY_ACC=CAM_ASM_000534 /LENGTH=511 /DNA_ID=CAMNT_0042791945 /DNA_START=93 /DNA_END=1628 /DNA_ORIENTATION=-
MDKRTKEKQIKIDEVLTFGKWGPGSEAVFSAQCCMLRRPRRHVLVNFISKLHAEKCLEPELEMDPLIYQFFNERLLRVDKVETRKEWKIRYCAVTEIKENVFWTRVPTVIWNAIDDWPALQKWVNKKKDAPPINLDGLISSFGHKTEIPVEYKDGSRKRLCLGDYLDKWKSKFDRSDEKDQIGYLKDFVYKSQSSSEAPTPIIFQGFRNWLSDDKNIGYNFLYLGARGSCTHLHCDVANSISWSASLAGRKRWRFVPCEHTHLLYDATGRHLAHDLPSTKHQSPWYARCRCSCSKLRCFPSIHLATILELIQEPGQVVLVPSGWYHTVENLDDALSVNANVLNAVNAPFVLSRLETHESADKEALFGGDNLSADAFLKVLFASLRADLKAFCKEKESVSLLFQIQRAAAMARLLASLGLLVSPNLFETKINKNILESADALLSKRQLATSVVLEHSFLNQLKQIRRHSGIIFGDEGGLKAAFLSAAEEEEQDPRGRAEWDDIASDEPVYVF